MFDIGITTREALNRLQADDDLILAGGTDEYSNGNGALMRILPLAFYQDEAPLTARFQLMRDVSAITHGHIRSAVACWLYLEVARHLRAGLPPAEAYAQMRAAGPGPALRAEYSGPRSRPVRAYPQWPPARCGRNGHRQRRLRAAHPGSRHSGACCATKPMPKPCWPPSTSATIPILPGP